MLYLLLNKIENSKPPYKNTARTAGGTSSGPQRASVYFESSEIFSFHSVFPHSFSGQKNTGIIISRLKGDYMRIIYSYRPKSMKANLNLYRSVKSYQKNVIF